MLLIQRVKQWLGYENLTAVDVNAEFNNLLNKAGADTLSGANSTSGSTATVNAMQATENPGNVGTEVLSTTVQEDIKQLRFQLNAIIGSAQWYSPPPTSITQINTALSGAGSIPASRIVSGRKDTNNQPMFLVPGGASNSVTLKATTTNFTAFFNSVSQTFTSDITLSGLTVAPAANNTAAVNDSSLTAQSFTKTLGERDSVITIGTIGSNITALQDKYAGFKIVDGATTEYFIGLVDTTNNRIRDCYRGFYFDSTDTWIQRRAVTNADTITLMKLTWVFATYNSATPGIDVTYTNPIISGTSPTTPASGDYWYDLTANTWKKFNGTSFVSVTACMIGVCLQDGTNTIAARSFDFFNSFSDLNSLELEKMSDSQIRSVKHGAKVSVYGSSYSFDYNNVVWDTSVNMDSGEAIAANTSFFMYMAPSSKVFISSLPPHQRKYDLRGDYHPSKPYRCIGEVLTDGSNKFIATTITIAPYHQRVLPPGFNSNVRLVKQTVSSTFLVGSNHPYINCDATGGAMIALLPPSSSQQAGTRFFIQKIDTSANTVTITPNGTSTIGGLTGSVILTGNNNGIELLSDGISNWQIAKSKISPTTQSFKSTLNYTFTVTAAAATTGATFTNNGQTFTVIYTIAAGTTLVCSGTGAPAASGTLTKASGTGDATITFASVAANGTYLLPVAATAIRVRMVGGGGGGSGQGAGAVSGGNGGDTTFGSSFLTAGGGVGGTPINNGSGQGGTGGTPTISSGVGISVRGGDGTGSLWNNTTSGQFSTGGTGGSSMLGGGARGGTANTGGGDAGAANSGGGGGGTGSPNASSGTAGRSGSGGGGGGGIDMIIQAPSSSYIFNLGGGGTGAAAGGSGVIYVEEVY